MKKALTAIYPGVYRYQTPENLAKIFAEFETKLRNSLAESEFFKLISQTVKPNSLRKYFSEPYNQDALLRERIFGGKTRLPFYFQIIGGKIIVTANVSPATLVKDSEIRKINGVATAEIIEKLLAVTKGDGENTRTHRVKSIEPNRFETEGYSLFDWYFPLFFLLKDEFFALEAVDFAAKKPCQSSSFGNDENRTRRGNGKALRQIADLRRLKIRDSKRFNRLSKDR